MGYELTAERLAAYCHAMREEEKSPETVEKYRRAMCAFACWLNGREVTKELAAEWKASLMAAGYAPASINAMLAAMNGLFRFLGWDGCRVRFLRVQRRLFREASRELTRGEYHRLYTAACALGRERLCLLMETLAATGMRVSEARYITVEAARLRGNRAQGQDTSDFAFRQAVPQAAAVRAGAGHLLGCGLPHAQRQGDQPPSDLGGAKGAVRACGGAAVQGVSPQPAPPVRDGVLQVVPGHRAACRRAGALFHRDHPAVPDDIRRGASAAAGTAGAGGIDGINIP